MAEEVRDFGFIFGASGYFLVFQTQGIELETGKDASSRCAAERSLDPLWRFTHGLVKEEALGLPSL